MASPETAVKPQLDLQIISDFTSSWSLSDEQRDLSPGKVYGLETPTSIAFVPFDTEYVTGINRETRLAVRRQAAKASAETRKKTIARKLAQRRSTSLDSSSSLSSTLSLSSLSSTSSNQDYVRRQSLPTASLDDDRSPSTPSSRRQSLSGIPRIPTASLKLEMFLPQQMAKWHPQIPDLIDYFLQHFACCTDMNRNIYRLQLWPLALEDASLFRALLLLAGSHAYLCQAMTVPAQILAHLKHGAIESVSDAVRMADAKGVISDGAVGAIALLGGWELEYGDWAAYKTHMRGLQTVVELRGGLAIGPESSPAVPSILSPIIDIALSVAHDMALYAGEAPSLLQDQAPTAIPPTPLKLRPGFELLKDQRLLLPMLLDLLSDISDLSATEHIFQSMLQEKIDAILSFDIIASLAARSCIFYTGLEDRYRWLAHSLGRLTGLSICEYLCANLGSPLSLNDQPSLLDQSACLDFEILIPTVYQDFTFWCLSMIYVTDMTSSHARLRLLINLRCLRPQIKSGTLASLDAFKSFLADFACPSEIAEDLVPGLWREIINETSDPFDDGGELFGFPLLAVHEPTRFAKGATLPSTFLDTVISVSEDLG